jgi:hypothetical protein
MSKDKDTPKDYKDMSMPEQASATLVSAGKSTVDSIASIANNQQSVANNANASAGQKAASAALATAGHGRCNERPDKDC